MIDTYNTDYQITEQSTTNGDTKTTIRVIKVENGYIISKEKYDNKEYKSITKKCWISTKDPLANDSKKDTLIDALDNISLTAGIDNKNKID